MRFLDFKHHFDGFNAISHQDIQNAFGSVNQSQLALWKRNGQIISARKGIYVLGDVPIDCQLLANELNDSYISLESALAHYQMIPEIVPSILSVSNKRSEKIENSFGTFSYHKIAPKLFCGFVLVESAIKDGRYVRMAEREKALFDLIYFRSDLKDTQDFDSLRLNIEGIDKERLRVFSKLVAAPQIKKRLDNFIRYLYALV